MIIATECVTCRLGIALVIEAIGILWDYCYCIHSRFTTGLLFPNFQSINYGIAAAEVARGLEWDYVQQMNF